MKAIPLDKAKFDSAIEKATTAQPPKRKKPKGAKPIGEAFDPSEPRDDHGRWTDTGWASSLTAREGGTLRHYASTGYASLNEQLRTGSVRPEWAPEVAEIDAALARATLPQPITVYRAATHIPDAGTYVDRAYVSMTGTESSARWNVDSMRKRGKAAVLVKMLLPAGMSAGHLVGGPFTMGEDEFLLPRGLTYRVVGREGDAVVVEPVV